MQLSCKLYSLWWFKYKISKTMVDYTLNLGGWLEEATLFPVGPNDYALDFDELLSNEKTNNEVDLSADLPDLDWLDEKINLSILGDPKSLLIQPDDAETLMLEDAARLLLDFDGNIDTSYLSPGDLKNELIETCNVEEQTLQFPIASPVSSDFIHASSGYESISEAGSPASFFSDGTGDHLSPGGVSTYSNMDGNISDAGPVVLVTICEGDTSDDGPVEETLSIDEVADSVLKKQFVSDGTRVPKVHVSLKNAFHPYSKGSSRKDDRNERKKLQNKEAATRYRIKKRNEENELSGEVSSLEMQQKELQRKHDDLASEIKYLKSLMREMFQKKGLLK